MDTAAWRQRFAGLHPREIDLGLHRMAERLNDLGSPEKTIGKLVHVAGTNGKGSVIACLEAAMLKAGKSVQTYTSPFLWNFEENIRLNGHALDPGKCADYFERLWQVNANRPLTWFEADTLVAFLAFQDFAADVTLIECGMGGGRDATAVAPAPTCAVLTNVARDHAEFLGNDLKLVAQEKAAIAKGSDLFVPEDLGYEVANVVRVPEDEGHPSLSLANAVLSAYFPEAVALEQVPSRPGRWQPHPKRKRTFLDVGHNAHAAGFLARKLANEPGPYRLSLGMLNRKDPIEFLRAFVRLKPEFTAIDLGEDGHSPRDLKKLALDLGMTEWAGQNEGTHLITGSHQTVAHALKSATLD